MKGNVIRLNIMHLNSVHLNSIGEVQSVSLKAGESTEDPVYPPTTYTLAANVSNGKVTATKNGTAISLPYVATEGDVIVLSVTPDEGYEFNGWLDGNKSNPRTVTMTGNVVLSASCVEIAKPTYTLSASVTNGKVTAKRNGSAVNLPFTANEGDVIVVSVTPNDGYAFEGWNDGNTDNPRSITMTADVVLSAQCVEVVAPPVGNYIQFEDAEVERVLMSKGVSSDGVGITMEDAAAVTSISTWFKGNTTIRSFKELVYFVNVTTLAYNAFSGCSSLTFIDLANILSLGGGTFYNCTKLATANLVNIRNIASYDFFGCSALAEDLNLPYLEKVGSEAFKNSGITSIIAPSILSMGYNSFSACKALKNIDLGSNLTTSGESAFYGCSALEIFICRATTPPTINGYYLYGTTCPIYVPDASVEAYKTATNWNQFADRIHPLSEIEGNNGVTLYDRLYGDGVAYIVTDYYLKGNEMIESVQQNTYINSKNKALWGAIGTNAKTCCITGGASSASVMQYVFYYGTTNFISDQKVSNSNYPQFRIKFSSNYLHIADREYSIGGSRVAIDAPFHIFARANDSAFWQGWIGQVVLSDEKTSEVLAKFTPASYNGEAGMYDEISGKFYGNAATSGTFYVENE